MAGEGGAQQLVTSTTAIPVGGGVVFTELGVVIESAALAGRLAAGFDSAVPLRAYEVRLAPEGNGLQWIERSASGDEKRHDHEPETSGLRRLGVQILSILPIESLL